MGSKQINYFILGLIGIVVILYTESWRVGLFFSGMLVGASFFDYFVSKEYKNE